MIRALALLALCAAAACATSEGARLDSALSAASAPAALADFTDEEHAEIARLEALSLTSPGVDGTARALAGLDWRSALSGRGPQRAFWDEGGGAYAAALAGRPPDGLSAADRAAAAQVALEAAQRSAAIAAQTQARASEAVAAAQRPDAAPERRATMLDAARGRAALLGAMAAAARADVGAITRDAQDLGVYGGPARGAMQDAAAGVARNAAEMEGRAALIARALDG